MTYCCGFMIAPDPQRVLLIQKNRPAFQNGKWNGVGGKIEPYENPIKAMVREFREETGIDTKPEEWELTIELSGISSESLEEFTVWYFRNYVNEIPEFTQMESEPLAVHELTSLYQIPTLDNLKWILPLQYTLNVTFPLHVWWEPLN